MNEVLLATRRWVEEVVIGLNLCPFAQREWRQNKVRLTVSDARSQEELLQHLVTELSLLNRKPSIETTLLIHPQMLSDFNEYNQFLDSVDAVIAHLALDGVFQVASFHPDYQFADTSCDDVENFTNRSPYPMLHILREASLDRAVDVHSDTSTIPVNNVALLRQLGLKHMANLLAHCRRDD